MFSACIFLHKIILHFGYYFHFLNAKVIQSFGCISVGYNIQKSLLSEENMKSRQKKEESISQVK